MIGDAASILGGSGARCSDVAEKISQIFGWRQTYKVEKLQRSLILSQSKSVPYTSGTLNKQQQQSQKHPPLRSTGSAPASVNASLRQSSKQEQPQQKVFTNSYFIHFHLFSYLKRLIITKCDVGSKPNIII